MQKLKDTLWLVLAFSMLGLLVFHVANLPEKAEAPYEWSFPKGARVIGSPIVLTADVPQALTIGDAWRNLEQEMEDRRIASRARESDAGHREASFLTFLQIRNDIRRALREWERRAPKK